jgi:hypothetical protein
MIAEDEFKKNERSAGRFHSDWLSMMYPRLKLARNRSRLVHKHLRQAQSSSIK